MSDNTTRRNRSRRTTQVKSERAPVVGTSDSGKTLDAVRQMTAAVTDDLPLPSQRPSMTPPEPYTFADAELDTARAAQDRIAAELKAQAERVERAKVSLAKARGDLEKLTARAVSAKPTMTNWYDHPGPLDRRRVQAETGLSGVALHRVMESYRTKHGGPARKATRGRR
jgi:hypothetical protein